MNWVVEENTMKQLSREKQDYKIGKRKNRKTEMRLKRKQVTTSHEQGKWKENTINREIGKHWLTKLGKRKKIG